VISYADEPFSTYINPALNTVNQQPFEMGSVSEKFLLQKIKKPEATLEVKS